MPLTRAQLLMGNETQGIVLTDQVQGVREASPPDGITIATDGTIHFDAASSTGTMKLNNPSAYNSYVWPTAKGTAGQQLETDASGNLFWADADGIDWTQKGQLLVGTGVGTGNETLLNPGPDNRVLKTSSGTASGLEWSELYVDVVPNITGAAVIPKGNTAQRPAAPLPGYLRMNQDFNTPDRLEVWDGDGPQWRQLAYVEDLPVLPPYAATVNTTLTGALYCSDFNISPGVTVTVEGGLFVFCSGDVTISGTLTASENGPSGARQFQGSFGPNTQITVGIGQGLGGGARNEGGFIYNVAVCPTGSGGGNGIISNTNAITMNGGAPGGGDGGGSIIIRSMRDINVTGGIVVSNGADGSISGNPNNIRFAGGGGGSGGTIILDASRNLTLNGAQILANGGVGGAGSNGGGAGGGGGGGYIITQVRYGVLNIIGATVRQANGGAGGPATVAATGTGAPGGGNAGKGGRAQNNAFGPGSHAGGIGSVSNFGSIYSLPNT